MRASCHGLPLPEPTEPAWALFLDLDGTLLDLAPRPEDVVVPVGLPWLLDSLSRHLGGALALISGRSLEGIDSLFPGGRDAAGSHGAEWRRGATSATIGLDWHRALTAGLGVAVAALPGVRVETKPCALALHYKANPAARAEVEKIAARLAAAAPLPLRTLAGKDVVELLPTGIDKGRAIERFMAQAPYAGRRPVFVGDDRTDEDGFAMVNRAGGISIKVGPEPTVARQRLTGPEAVRAWLGCLDQSLGGVA